MNFTHSQITFLRHLASHGSIEKLASAAAEFFHTHHGLGRRAGSRFLYAQADSDRAVQMLSNRGISVAQPEQGLRRRDSFLNNPTSEKSGTLSPHHDSVAVKIASGHSRAQGLCEAGFGYQVLTAEQAISVATDVLLVVENLESFRFLERNPWIQYEGKDVLAIFRGDNFLRADTAIKVIESRREPVWAYFDFDPAGLGMASRLPRLERLLLPSEPILSTSTRRANQVHLFADQLAQWSATLDADDREIICAPWRHMKHLRLGLAQEHMDSLKR